MTATDIFQAAGKAISASNSQRAFSMVVVLLMLFGAHHWADEYFSKIMVPRAEADVLTMTATREQGAENTRNIATIAVNSAEQTALMRTLVAQQVTRHGGIEGVVVGEARKDAAANAARFDFNEGLRCPENKN